MKKLFLILAITLVSCTTDKVENNPQNNCYDIIARGYDNRGNYIIIKYNSENKRYMVGNYLDWINQTQICEPINLTEQPL